MGVVTVSKRFCNAIVIVERFDGPLMKIVVALHTLAVPGKPRMSSGLWLMRKQRKCSQKMWLLLQPGGGGGGSDV